MADFDGNGLDDFVLIIYTSTTLELHYFQNLATPCVGSFSNYTTDCQDTDGDGSCELQRTYNISVPSVGAGYCPHADGFVEDASCVCPCTTNTVSFGVTAAGVFARCLEGGTGGTCYMPVCQTFDFAASTSRAVKNKESASFLSSTVTVTTVGRLIVCMHARMNE